VKHCWTNKCSGIWLWRHRFMRHLVSAVRYFVAPIKPSHLTTALHYTIRTIFIYNDTKQSVPLITITNFDCTKYNPLPPHKINNYKQNTLTSQECWQCIKCCSSFCLLLPSSSLVTWKVESVSLRTFTATCPLMVLHCLSEKYQTTSVYFTNYSGSRNKNNKNIEAAATATLEEE